MATQADVSTHPLAGPKVLYRSSTMDPKERFYRHFLESDAGKQQVLTVNRVFYSSTRWAESCRN